MKIEDIFLHRIRFKQPCHGLPMGTVGMVYQVTQKPSGEVYFTAVCFPPVQVLQPHNPEKDSREYESLPVFVHDANIIDFAERIEVLEGDDYTSTLWNQAILEWTMRHAPCGRHARIIHDRKIFFCSVCGAKGEHYKNVRTEKAPENLSGIVTFVEFTDTEGTEKQ